MGRALFDRQRINVYLERHIIKHMLRWPIQFKDLESVHEDYYKKLKQIQTLAESGDDVHMLCLEFTTVEEIAGTKEEVELVEGGSDIKVTNENLPEYIQACFEHRIFGKVRPQLNELLLGIFDVVPEPILAVFNPQELERLLCGLHEIIDDLEENTEYTGEFCEVRADHPTCQWFWEVVSEFDQEMREQLLCFVIGEYDAPVGGLDILRGHDGNIRKLTICGVPLSGVCPWPCRAFAQ
jgi:hypothetical protein